MRPIAYVSDENYVALAGVRADFEPRGGGAVITLNSSARGAFYDVPPGVYRVVLSKEGFGAKWVDCELGGGDPYQFRLLSAQIFGYMWPKWAAAGAQSEIRVHSPEQYQLTLWRYGLKKEFARMIGWFDEHGPGATEQITPDGDYSQTGVHWNLHGYPSVPLQHFVTAPSRSGLYYLWARTASGMKFSFPWVISPVQPQAKIAVLASTNTWNAYNNFGGRSNYINPGGLPPAPTVNARLDLERYTSRMGVWSIPDEEFKPLAFERPEPGNHIFDNSPWTDSSITDPIQGRLQCGQAPAEWRLLGWLEREGFDYDYYAEAQLHEGTLPLDAYKILVLSVHPEYWSREMFDKVQHWVHELGGRLIYLGGNGVNCEVLPEGDSMRCLSHEDKGTMSGVYESRMHRTHRSEAGLLGVAFTYSGAMTAARYRVIDAEHWVFCQTGLQKDDLFGENSLHERVPGGASGHETDKISPSSPTTLRHLAQGVNEEGGGADMVYFEPGRGAVFSVGSITWTCCLFPDKNISRITRNVIERFLQ